LESDSIPSSGREATTLLPDPGLAEPGGAEGLRSGQEPRIGGIQNPGRERLEPSHVREEEASQPGRFWGRVVGKITGTEFGVFFGISPPENGSRRGLKEREGERERAQRERGGERDGERGR